MPENSSFEDAARRMLGAPPYAKVYSEWYDGGDDGCDTCGNGSTPGSIDITAMADGRAWKREFTDLPSLWDALFTDETDTP